jgi:hypothetical protein
VGKGKTTQPKRASTSTAKSTAKKGSTKLTVAKGGKRNSKKTTVDQCDNPNGCTPVCVVEVKTRTTETTIQVAEALAEKYKTKDGVIWAEVEDDAWNELVPKDHSDQVILQMIVSGCVTCCYLCSRPGTEHQKGRILYQVVAKICQELMSEKLRKLYKTTKDILEPLFICDNIDVLCHQLPTNLSKSDLEVIKVSATASKPKTSSL